MVIPRLMLRNSPEFLQTLCADSVDRNYLNIMTSVIDFIEELPPTGRIARTVLFISDNHKGIPDSGADVPHSSETIGTLLAVSELFLQYPVAKEQTIQVLHPGACIDASGGRRELHV